MTKVIGVRFRQAGKVYFFSPGKLHVKQGDKVIDLIPIDEQKQYMVCKINESIKELTYPLSEKHDNSEITLLTLADHEERLCMIELGVNE